MEKVRFECDGFIKIGKATNPSYYVLVPKKFLKDGLLKDVGQYIVEIEAKDVLPSFENESVPNLS